jgi:hypothetical protein
VDNLPKAIQPYAVVTNETGEKQAVKLRGKIKHRITKLSDELFIKNRNAQMIINENNAEYKPKIEQLKTWDRIIESACKKFRTEQLAAVATVKKELTVAQIEKDKVVTSPIPETIIESVPLPSKTIRTNEASMSYIPKIKVKVTDIEKVPVFYDPSPITERYEKIQLLVVNTVGLNELLRTKKGYKIVDGKIISGIEGLEFYEDMSTRLYGGK